MSLPGLHGKFPVITADVPWRYLVRSKKGMGRSPKYQTMTLDAIAALPVVQHATKDSYLFFWITGPFFVLGKHIPIMRMWGFQPVATAFVWAKISKGADMQKLTERSFVIGTGYTTRKNPEFCILGRRGSPPSRLRKDIRELIIAPRREHSRKPDEFFKRVEAYANGPYLELFSRENRPGWKCWGDEEGKFNA